MAEKDLKTLTNEITALHDAIAKDMAKPTVKAAAKRARVNMGKVQKLYKEFRQISLK